MAEIAIDLDDAVEDALKRRATANQRSLEAEIRVILAQTVGFVPLDAEGISVRPMSFRDFVGIASVRRTQNDIDLHIRALRDEWHD